MGNSMENPSYMASEKLTEFGRQTARRFEASSRVKGRAVSSRIYQNLKTLHSLSKPENTVSGSAGEWLNDNWYLARREGISAAGAFRHAGKITSAGAKPLIISSAEELLRSGDGEVSAQRIVLFLEGFQQHRPLPRRELDLFIPALKACAIESLCDENLSGEKAGRLFSALRFLSDHDLNRELDSLDPTERTLMQDPAGIYPRMSRATRENYRRRVEVLARKQNISEHIMVRRILRNASEARGSRRHVGHWLFAGRDNSGLGYIAANLILSLGISIALGLKLGFLAAVLLILPISAAVKAIVDLLLLRLLPPRHMARMALENGVPPEGKTVCVISALLTDEKAGVQLARQLEEYHLLNRSAGENLVFGILADLPESEKQEIPEAKKWLSAAELAVEELNRKYKASFLLLTRGRVLSEGRYMGWERKRGAIAELARALRGQKSGIHCRAGDLHSLMGAKYILTLDSDTQMTPNSALKLIAAMLHPLNKAVIDEKRGIVASGHGIIQPRISTRLNSATKTPFARLFAGQGGVDPYSSTCGEVYMDLTGTSVFSGKGIMDIDAFLRCADIFPEGKILSHDALEGAYLRCGYAGDIEMTDSFPSGVLGFYRRAHRWIRGDWQNSPWLFASGRKLSDMDRWRLFDSLRRSLVSPTVLLSILYSFFGGKWAVGAIAAGCFAANLFLALLHSIIHRPEHSERYHSTVISGLPGALCQSGVMLILLPFEAYTQLSAICTALYRMLISKKGLLEWSTAAQSEGKASIASHLRAMLPAAILGILCIRLSPAIVGKAAGVLWLCSPFAAFLLSRAYPNRRQKLSCRDRCWLLTHVRQMWGYFETYMNADNHWLPPDNWQERPPVGLARRTSPTNIGLALICTLSAADLGIIEPKKAGEIIDRSLSTIESLEKWNGHLFNWYDTGNLQVLQPPYVSTVDSGNLCACLMALSGGLREYGFDALAHRADALAAGMSFAPMLDEEKMLLKIGINTASDSHDSGCYDLLAGEARLTAYLAVSRGDVPKKLWERMSRALVAKGHRRGMASWTGTMFEYLMPELLLPLVHGSLLYETHHFCLYVQRRRSRMKPWGCSESAYHSLDPSLSYRYKAHGCQALALHPGMDEELVIAPYASFLALILDAPAAISNLRALEKAGAVGLYGFWEAVDFTPVRQRSTEGEIVRCVMAHHLGMSIISAANLIQNSVWQRRFMRMGENRAYACLLEERIPLNAPTLRKSVSSAEEQRPQRQRGLWSLAQEVKPEERLECNVLTNGTYSVMSTSCGASLSRCGDILIYAPQDPLRPVSHGMDFFITMGSKQQCLLPCDTGEFGYSFTQRESSIRCRQGRLSSNITTTLCADCSGERRSISILTEGEGLYSGTLTVALKPVLAFENDYVNHPAFFGLGMEAQSIPNGVIIRRLSRGKLDECYLCVKCDRAFEAELSENSMSPRYRCKKQTEGWLVRPNLRLDIPLELTGGREEKLNLALGFGATAEAAENCSDRALAVSGDDCAALPELSAALLDMDAQEVAQAMEMLPAIVYPRVKNADKLSVLEGRGPLWAHGISGDHPILLFDASDPDKLQEAERIIRRCAYLKSLSIPFDLAIIVSDGGDYHRKNQNRLNRMLIRYGLEHLLGTRSGIHLIDSEKPLSAVVNSAALIIDSEGNIVYNKLFMSTNFLPLAAVKLPEISTEEQNCFNYYVNSSLPPAAWCNTLSNGHFGYLAADCGTGFMWMENARECPVTPWLNDPAAVTGYEELELWLGEEKRSLFASPEGETKVKYYPGAAVWEHKKARMTAFVPTDVNARVVIIECSGAASVRWKMPVQLSGNTTDRPYCVCDYVNSTFTAVNPRSDSPRQFHALFSAQPEGFELGKLSPGFEAMLPLNNRLILVCGCDDEEKLHSLTVPEKAMEALQYTLRYWKCRTGRLTVSTGHGALDRMMSPWAAYQAQSCRILGRTSIYQSGGATGFRDQLQDVVSLLITHREQCREHILSSCRHQYREGDVMHWWHAHPDGDRGVRTHCSDDLGWLPWAVCEYADKTGDKSILEEKTPYLVSDELGENDHDRYETPAISHEQGTVKEHCTRALDMVLRRGTGEHGLLKMLGGDWNDGMDKVYGESLWLTWFFAHTAERFAALTGEEKYRAESEKLTKAAESAWDTDHWLRGYFRDGTPLGESAGAACKIDSIAQSFACLCKGVSPEKLSTALDSALRMLRMGKVTALFTPPFEGEGPDPGYIRSYGPGFRENGGQYTHAGIWLAMACLKTDKHEEGLKILLDILPENHDSALYGAEPFVIPADVSTDEHHFGEAGWTWYTGSAGWYWRIVTEELLGLVPREGRLRIEPKNIPSLASYSFTWQSAAGDRYNVHVAGTGVTVNGAQYDGKGLPL